jgi:hypothetical protein
MADISDSEDEFGLETLSQEFIHELEKAEEAFPSRYAL